MMTTEALTAQILSILGDQELSTSQITDAVFETCNPAFTSHATLTERVRRTLLTMAESGLVLGKRPGRGVLAAKRWRLA